MTRGVRVSQPTTNKWSRNVGCYHSRSTCQDGLGLRATVSQDSCCTSRDYPVSGRSMTLKSSIPIIVGTLGRPPHRGP